MSNQLIASKKSVVELDGAFYSKKVLCLVDDPDEPEVTEPDEQPFPMDEETDEEEED